MSSSSMILSGSSRISHRAHSCGLFDADAVFPVGDDEPDKGGDDDQFDGEMEAVEDGFETWVGIPACA